jgi:DNA-binding transcriptional ArsR family regulator
VINLSEPRKLKRVVATVEAFKTERLRWVLGQSQVGLKIDEERYRALSQRIMRDEMERQMILHEIRERGPLTIKELSKATDISPKEILRHIIALRKNGVLAEVGEKDGWYLYKIT